MKNIKGFYLKIFGFLEVKFSIYLNRRVFVMTGVILQFITHKHKLHLISQHSNTVLSGSTLLPEFLMAIGDPGKPNTDQNIDIFLIYQ